MALKTPEFPLMSLVSTHAPHARVAASAAGFRPAWPAAFLLALAATAFVTAMGWRAAGTGLPNSDDLMRLVEVRDLLAGQGWFDLAQYRLGLEGGTVMHWSRLVDAPIAAIIVAVNAVTGDMALAESAAKFLWPAVTAFLATVALMAGCIRTGNRDAMVPAAIIGAVALWSVGVFSPGALDHHNIQAALALWLLALLLPGRGLAGAHAAAGVVAVLMLAIGMEVLPYVVTAGAVVSISFLLGTTAAPAVRAFGLAAAAAAALVFVATIAPDNYGTAACDAFSSFHLVAAMIGGLGLAGATLFSGTAARRFAGLAVTSAVLFAAVAAFFPNCLENPLSALDPELRTFWLDGVVETRSLPELLATDPFAVLGLYGMALTALVVSVLSAVRGRHARNRSLVFAGFLAMAIAVTCWQQRGFVFAAVFAVLPLAFWVTRLRARYARNAAAGRALAMAGAWIVSINLVWWTAGTQAAALVSKSPTLQEQVAAASPRDYCYTADLYRPLADRPAGVVLGATDIGASLLLFTGDRAIAGPYHRDAAGILFLIDAMLASPDRAHAMLRQAGVDYVADCIAAADAADFIAASPNGFQAALRDDVPGWLEPLPETIGSPLVIYRVKN